MTKGGRKGPPKAPPKQPERAKPPEPYDLRVEEEAEADLRVLDKKTRRILTDHIKKDLAFPYQAANVKPIDAGFRLKVGDFRVFYVVDNASRTVAVTNVVRRGPGTYR